MLVMVGVCACTDELEGLGISSIRPTDVICFTASLSDNRPDSQTRSASGHLEIEQEEWLVGERIVTRGKPVTSLEGSAGVIGYVYDEWSTSVKPWSGLYNTEYVFNGDELTAKENDVRWNTLKLSKARFYVYAPYSINGGRLSNNEQGGNPTITYTVDATPANQQDLIVASWDGPASHKQSIPLSFEHALTAVKFKVGFECTVTKLEVIGIYNSGTYTFGDGWEVSTTSSTGNYEISSLTEDNTLMMIPQKLGPDAKVVLQYTKDGETIICDGTKLFSPDGIIDHNYTTDVPLYCGVYDMYIGEDKVCEFNFYCDENSIEYVKELILQNIVILTRD